MKNFKLFIPVYLILILSIILFSFNNLIIKAYADENVYTDFKDDYVYLFNIEENVKLCSVDEARNIFENFLLIDPYWFLYDDNTYLRNDLSYIDLEYTEYQYSFIENMAIQITQDAISQYDKIRKVCEYLAENIYYDYDYYNHGRRPGYWDPFHCLSEGYTHCAGYSHTARVLLKTIGIPCIIINAPDHMYNAAYDGTRWILFDATWCSGNKYEYEIKTYKKSSLKNWFDFSIDTALQESNHVIEDMEYTRIFNELKNVPWYFDNEKINIVVNDNIEIIGRRAFDSCIYLVDLIIPDTVKSIEYWAFFNCTNLTNITIPDSVTYINGNVFLIVSYKIGSTIYMIGNPNLTILTFKGSYAHSYAIDYRYPYILLTTKSQTEITISNNIYEFNINVIYPVADSILIAATYNSIGQLLEMKTAQVMESTSSIILTMDYTIGATNAKIMIWSGLNTMEPLCETEILLSLYLP